jgi:hypothetical protein
LQQIENSRETIDSLLTGVENAPVGMGADQGLAW